MSFKYYGIYTTSKKTCRCIKLHHERRLHTYSPENGIKRNELSDSLLWMIEIKNKYGCILHLVTMK